MSNAGRLRSCAIRRSNDCLVRGVWLAGEDAPSGSKTQYRVDLELRGQGSRGPVSRVLGLLLHGHADDPLKKTQPLFDDVRPSRGRPVMIHAIPCSMNRLRHLLTVWRSARTSRLISMFSKLLDANKMMFER
jgi:hypothetical protein